MDARTAEIVQYLEELPLAKKQAILELVKPSPQSNPLQAEETWQERWLSIPTVSEETLRSIEAVHDELNAWQPRTW